LLLLLLSFPLGSLAAFNEFPSFLFMPDAICYAYFALLTSRGLQ
jgi:hypothetical protein